RDAYDGLEEGRGTNPSWLARLRTESFGRFQEMGFPTTRLEAWKYTNPAPIAERKWSPATGRGASLKLDEPTLAPIRIPGAIEAVFVNGLFSPELSRGEAREGLRIGSLAEILRQSPEQVEPWLSQIGTSSGAFANWNTAFFRDGAYVAMAPGAILREPIHLLFLTLEEEALAVSSPRVLVIAGARSQATIVERYNGEGVALTNAVTEVAVG